jgi:photosystem I P700 chlorophyll a apoprotein A1
MRKLITIALATVATLSITQGRAVGLAHYLLGGIGTTWSFFLARAVSIG